VGLAQKAGARLSNCGLAIVDCGLKEADYHKASVRSHAKPQSKDSSGEILKATSTMIQEAFLFAHKSHFPSRLGAFA